MGIIEELEITPVVSFRDDHNLSVCNEKPVRKVEQQNNILLEALIRNLELNQRGYFMKEKILKDIIEKIAGIPWKEIKELL